MTNLLLRGIKTNGNIFDNPVYFSLYLWLHKKTGFEAFQKHCKLLIYRHLGLWATITHQVCFV